MLTYNSQYSYNDAMSYYNNSDHNIVQNITFISDDCTRIGSGIGFHTASGTTATCDSNLIQNNFVPRAGWAIYIGAVLSPFRATGNIVRGNHVGSETDSLISRGIFIEKCQNTIIEDNIVQNIKSTPAVGLVVNLGITSSQGIGDIIRNNVVHNMSSTTGYTCVGISLSGDANINGSENQVYNNMVYDIQSTSIQWNSRVAGLQLWYQSNPRIYFNSVSLHGSGNGANPHGSAALYVYKNVRILI